MRIHIDAFLLVLYAVAVCLPFLTEACPGNTFQCHDYKKCVPRELLCDHYADCEDNSDELDCKFKPCPRNTYRCRESRLCVPYISLCNGTTECPNGEDEGGQCGQECPPHQSMAGSWRFCEVCHTSPEGPICSCPEGKIFAEDTSKLCIGDHNMCREDGRCDQRCVSSYDSEDDVGSFTCECYEGYSLHRDGCQYAGTEDPYIVLSGRHELYIYNIKTGISSSLISGLENAVSLDFDYNNGLIYWSDVSDDIIYRGTLDTSSPTSGIKDTIPLIQYGLATSEGIAVDWIGHNIYWTHRAPDQIEVADLSGIYRKTLISRNVKRPRAIALDPRDGLLFWSDWDESSPRIERATMAGLDREIIVNVTDVSGAWPNGLTLDLWERKVYWVDAKSDSLCSSYYNGSHIKWVLQMNPHIVHPFSVATFEDRVYWTDWRSNGLLSVNKWTGNDVAEVQSINAQPFGVQVLHPTKQPTANNPCASSSCSHFCLINSDTSYVCACPYLMEMGDDRQNCINTTSFLVFAKSGQIHGVHVNSMENVIPVLSDIPALNLTSVDHDVVMGHIYFANVKNNMVGRVNIRDLEEEPVMEGLTNVQEVAVDWISRNIYVMVNSDEGKTVLVSSVDGNYPLRINVHLTEASRSLTLDPANGYMYWVNGNEEGNTPSIHRAEMNGDNHHILLSNVYNPKGLALDRDTMTLYWIDRTTFDGGQPGIFYSLMNFPSRQQLPCEFSSNDSPQSITVHQGRIYWFEESINMIRAVDISSPSEVINLLQTSEGIIGRMFVYDMESQIGDTNGCSIDNGGCNQLCIPKPTSNPPRVCACTAGFSLDRDETTCTGVAEFVMYSTTTSIRGISMEADNDQPQMPPIIGQTQVQSVDFHAEENMIYWVDVDQQKINRIRRDHTGQETVISTDRDLIGIIAIDAVSGNIYWTDQRMNTINVARINTWEKYVVVRDSFGLVSSIAVEPTAGYLFWMTSEPDQPSVYRALLDGSNPIRIFSDILIEPKSLTISDGKLYICENSRIIRTDLNGHNQEIVFTTADSDQYSISKIAVGKQFVYWIDNDYQSGSILRIDKRQSEGEIELLQDNIISGEGITATDITIYSKDRQIGLNLCSVENGGCEQLCFFKGGSDKECACAQGKLADDSSSCNPYEEYILYSSGKRIEITPFGDGDNMGSVDTLIDDENIVAIASAFPQKGVFYSDIQRRVVMFKSMEDQSEDVTILRDAPSVEGIAFNHVTNELFWTSYTNSSINRMAVFTAQPAVQHLVFRLDADDHPRGIALDVCRGDIYWTNWSGQRPSIMTSTMSGGNLRTIINTDIVMPNGIVLDPHPSKLYWCDARLDKIERADLDGSHRKVIVTSGVMHPFGITVHDDFLYWTDWLSRNLTRVNKYNGENVRVIQSRFTSSPMGITVFTEPYKCEDLPCSWYNGGCDDQCEVDEYGAIFCSCTRPLTVVHNDRRRCVQAYSEPCEGFLCGQGGCISTKQVCDGEDDCSDGSDEFDSYCRCPRHQFECRFGECIDESQRCDHVKDCSNTLDEIDCGPFNCSNWLPDHVEQKEIGLYENCSGTSVCVKSSDRCDGVNNCGDNSDEDGCGDSEANTCKHDEMSCGDDPTTCIFIHQKCDAHEDCPDGSDERNCP